MNQCFLDEAGGCGRPIIQMNDDMQALMGSDGTQLDAENVQARVRRLVGCYRLVWLCARGLLSEQNLFAEVEQVATRKRVHT